MPNAVMWFRRDLRLADNPALMAALEHAGPRGEVMALYVLDPNLLRYAGEPRKAYLFETLRALNAQLDGQLVVRTGSPVDVLHEVAQDKHVFASADFGPYGRLRDEDVSASGIHIEFVGSPYAVDPGSVTTGAGTPFKVFTPYSKAWQSFGWEKPDEMPADVRWSKADSEPIPVAPPELVKVLPPVGESAVIDQFETFLAHRVRDYATLRDVPGVDGTSRLSTALRWGVIHPRTILARLGETDGERKFRGEICWRDFYAEVLYSFPASAREDLNPIGEITYDSGKVADQRFDAWCAGETGYPIVDAGMRQLVQEGWIHNRVRMITASFLVKDLHLWWRKGARHFMRHLVDGDLASNQHGWQWSAGTGTDAAPYFRVFNPTTQGQRFDAEGAYIKRWIPELAGLDAQRVHEPWKASSGLFTDDLDYPKPIVDHATERDETLRRYKVR